jgi:hypothetical protein
MLEELRAAAQGEQGTRSQHFVATIAVTNTAVVSTVPHNYRRRRQSPSPILPSSSLSPTTIAAVAHRRHQHRRRPHCPPQLSPPSPIVVTTAAAVLRIGIVRVVTIITTTTTTTTTTVRRRHRHGEQ